MDIVTLLLLDFDGSPPPPNTHQTVENIAISVVCLCVATPPWLRPAASFLPSSSVIHLSCCCPRCYPVTHQPLEDVRQGQEGLLSQQTSVSFRVAAKSAISS